MNQYLVAVYKIHLELGYLTTAIEYCKEAYQLMLKFNPHEAAELYVEMKMQLRQFDPEKYNDDYEPDEDWFDI